jgi:hypothetical protein
MEGDDEGGVKKKVKLKKKRIKKGGWEVDMSRS